MTTAVKVSANHGWPVDVTPVDPKTGEMGVTTRLLPRAEQTFHAHSGQDLMIHEVQPEELKEKV